MKRIIAMMECAVLAGMMVCVSPLVSQQEAEAQWQVPNYSMPVGRGTGTGFKTLGPCATGGFPVWNSGAAADPICSTVSGASATLNGQMIIAPPTVATASVAEHLGRGINSQMSWTYTGGGSYVNSNYLAQSVVSSGVTDYVWNILSLLYNDAAAGQNVGIYSQAIKRAAGPTWAMVAEVRDSTHQNNPANALQAIEVDVVANGTDSNSNRSGIVVGVFRESAAQANVVAGQAISIFTNSSDVANATWTNGIVFQNSNTMTNGISWTAGGSYSVGLNMAATFATAIDMHSATISTNAIWLGDDKRILLDSAGNTSLVYDSTLTGLLVTQNTAAGNSIDNLLTLRHTANGTFAAGTGVGIDFSVMTAAATTKNAGYAQVVSTNVGAGAETFDFVVQLMNAGSSAAEKFRVTGAGNAKISGTQYVYQSGGVTGTLAWAPSSSNKTITLPNGTTDFTATGGTSQVVKQTSSGGAFTVARLACADLSDAGTGCTAAYTGANPSASVGLSAVNGSAITYMRSDGAPALSQAIAPTWTAQHIWSQATTIASATAAALDDVKVAAATTTITGNTGSPITRLAKVGLYRPTITDSSAVTVTDAATLYIDNSPLAAGSATITNPWALLVGAGKSKFLGDVQAASGTTSISSTTGAFVITGTGGLGVGGAAFIGGGMAVIGDSGFGSAVGICAAVGVPSNCGGQIFTFGSNTAGTYSWIQTWASTVLTLNSQGNNVVVGATSGSQTLTVVGTLGVSDNIIMNAATKTLTLKQGANGSVGTFVCNGATPVTVNNTNIAVTDAISISLNTVGGTVGAHPTIRTITAATGFTVACTASDTSTMNYAIIKNAAWLMKRDLNPAANDNSPAFMENVA